MWRNDGQACRAIRLLLKPLDLDHLWTVTGPTPQAMRYLEGNPLSSGEDIMLRAAFDVWGRDGKVKLNEILHSLDQEHTALLFSLIVALGEGSDVVDDWIAYQESKPLKKTLFEETDEELLSRLGLDPRKWKVNRPAVQP